MLRRWISAVVMGCLALSIGLMLPDRVRAQTDNGVQYSRGRVVKIVSQQALPGDGQDFYVQTVQVHRSDTGEQIELSVGTEFQPLTAQQRLHVGQGVILGQQVLQDGSLEYVIADVDRMPVLIWLFGGFLVIVLVVARLQGALSIVGMGVSLAVLGGWIVPAILNGQDPVVVTLLGAAVIATLTMYLSHGFKLASHLSLMAMMSTLVAVAALSWMAVKMGYLVGLGTEEAYYLQFGPSAHLNLQGLLLGGIVLGALGILDDICVAQVSVVQQLKLANLKLDFTELYQRGLEVGKDHVASLVNTLMLAYVSANLPLFLLFNLNQNAPWWVVLNNQVLAEEIVRTLVGSIGLVLAVPLSTLLAAWAYHRLPAVARQASAKTAAAHGPHHH